MRSKELQEMKLCYPRLAWNDVRMNAWKVAGKSSGDVRFRQQIDTVQRIGALILHQHYSPESHDSIFASLRDGPIPRSTIEDLKAEGFSLIAKANTPWTYEEDDKLQQAVLDLQRDPTFIGTYGSVEKWIGWSILGNSRASGAVAKRMKC